MGIRPSFRQSAELRRTRSNPYIPVRRSILGAGYENRTRISCLGSKRTTTVLIPLPECFAQAEEGRVPASSAGRRGGDYHPDAIKIFDFALASRTLDLTTKLKFSSNRSCTNPAYKKVYEPLLASNSFMASSALGRSWSYTDKVAQAEFPE